MIASARAALVRILEAELGTNTQVVVAPDQVTPPCLLIGMPTIDYGTTGGGLMELVWPLFAILPRAHDVAAVAQADAWVAPDGVRRIVMADQSWAGTISAVFIRSAVAELYDGPTGQLPQYRWDMEVKL